MRAAELAAFVLSGLLLAACATPPSRAPVADRSNADVSAKTYRVRTGDTLYSIAWRHGLDYRELARRNGIGKPYLIHPGQVLILRAARTVSAVATAPTSRSVATPPPRGDWRWPGVGELKRGYGNGNKGIDLALHSGTSIGAVAAGEVVYAGSGLRGYRSLVIVKHDARWLSAYSFNQPGRVTEGQTIKAGEALADIVGEGSATLLHFEIRRNGDPVDPRTLISMP